MTTGQHLVQDEQGEAVVFQVHEWLHEQLIYYSGIQQYYVMQVPDDRNTESQACYTIIATASVRNSASYPAHGQPVQQSYSYL